MKDLPHQPQYEFTFEPPVAHDADGVCNDLETPFIAYAAEDTDDGTQAYEATEPAATSYSTACEEALNADSELIFSHMTTDPDTLESYVTSHTVLLDIHYGEQAAIARIDRDEDGLITTTITTPGSSEKQIFFTNYDGTVHMMASDQDIATSTALSDDELTKLTGALKESEPMTVYGTDFFDPDSVALFGPPPWTDFDENMYEVDAEDMAIQAIDKLGDLIRLMGADGQYAASVEDRSGRYDADGKQQPLSIFGRTPKGLNRHNFEIRFEAGRGHRNKNTPYGKAVLDEYLSTPPDTALRQEKQNAEAEGRMPRKFLKHIARSALLEVTGGMLHRTTQICQKYSDGTQDPVVTSTRLATLADVYQFQYLSRGHLVPLPPTPRT